MRIKTKDQLLRIHESCQLLARMFHDIESQIGEGTNLLELDRWAQDYILRHKAKPAFKGYRNYPATLCTSVNHEVIHGIPRPRKLKNGDLLSVDCGINLNGYISDMAKTFPIGEASAEDQKLLQVTQESLWAGIRAVKPQGRLKDISIAISKVIEPHGYGIVHEFCGHGVGFSVHEDPEVPNYVRVGPNPRLPPGLVIAIEPMVNLGTPEVNILDDGWTVVTRDGKNSAHFEHTVAVTEEGYWVLTELLP
jgi:methionyl aminopeptidase